jgi:hypothetical protein
MNERAKITADHLSRQAIVYLRQSSAAQVENNRESTDRQYALAAKARELGWPADRIVVIDEDLGLSGSSFVARSGFARLTAEVALAHVGLVLGLMARLRRFASFAEPRRNCGSRPETDRQPSVSDQGEQSPHQLAVWLGQRFEDREMVGPVDWQQMPRQSVPGPRLGVVNRLAA